MRNFVAIALLLVWVLTERPVEFVCEELGIVPDVVRWGCILRNHVPKLVKFLLRRLRLVSLSLEVALSVHVVDTFVCELAIGAGVAIDAGVILPLACEHLGEVVTLHVANLAIILFYDIGDLHRCGHCGDAQAQKESLADIHAYLIAFFCFLKFS